jgi:hypothetical protein
MPFLIPFAAAAIGAIGAVAGVIAIGAIAIAGVIALGALLKPKIPNTNAASAGALQNTLNPEEYRKIVFGKTVGGNDTRYWEVYGKAGYDQIIVVATHKINSFQGMWIEGNGPQTFDGSGNANGTFTVNNGDGSTSSVSYAGILNVLYKTVGVTGTFLAAGAGTLWAGISGKYPSLTGCAYYRLKWTYNQSKLPNGFPTKFIQVVEGAFVYDPRLDSTNGGSGSHRYYDQTTWSYATLDSNSVPIGRNNALQALWYLLGWTITNPSTGATTLVAGRGIQPGDIDFSSFIQAANDCESAHYYSDMILSTGDSHTTNESIISAASQAIIADTGGLWTYKVAVDDTSNIAVAFTDDDVVSSFSWNPKAPIINTYNQVDGSFIDTSVNSLYQSAPYPIVSDSGYLTQDDNIPDRQQLDFQSIQDASQAQKLARIWLNKNRLTGQFKASFNWKALQARNYDCVTLTFSYLGWNAKLFRIVNMAINPMGAVDLVLQEENSSVYAGGAIIAYVPPIVGSVYNVQQQVDLTGLSATAIAVPSGGTQAIDGIVITWTPVLPNVKKVELLYKKSSDTNYISAGNFTSDISETLLTPIQPNTNYDIIGRTITVNNIASNYAYLTVTSAGYTTATANQSFQQNTDPALTQVILDGAFWSDTNTNHLKLRLSGTWVIVADISASGPVGGGGAGLSDGDILLSSTTSGSGSFTVPSNALGFIWIEVWAVGGNGVLYVSGGGKGGGGSSVSYGGGGGQYFKHHMAVTPGSTVIAYNLGTVNTNSTVTSPALTAHCGVTGSGASAGAGGAGTTGANLTTTNGRNGGLTNTWDGGGAGNGGGDQTTDGNMGTAPGGGSGGYAGSPSPAKILITTKAT